MSINRPAGSANTNVSGNNSPVVISANYTPPQELMVQIVTGGTNVNSGNNLLIIKSLTPTKVVSALSCALPDQQAANAVLTSSVSVNTATALAEWYSYINLGQNTVNYIRINTSNVAVYNGKLNYGVMPATGISQPSYWPLSNYAKLTGTTYAPDLYINVMPDGRTPMIWPITSQTYLYFDNIPASTTVTIYFGLIGTGQNNVN